MEDTIDTIKEGIYKINYISNKRIEETQIPEKIIVFYGKTNPATTKNWEITIEELNTQFEQYIESLSISDEELQREEVEAKKDYSIFQNIFSEHELDNIKKYKIKVEFSFDRLYGDDTIETVKKKIITNVHLDVELSFDEIYLFFKRGVVYTPMQLYNKLSNNDTASITKKSLIDFLTNSHRRSLKYECELIIRSNTEDLKDYYTYNDIVELFYEVKEEDITGNESDEDAKSESSSESNSQEVILLSKVPIIEDMAIGQRLLYNNSDYVYTINPFSVTDISSFLKEETRNIISTNNKSILLDYDPNVCKTIFLCIASDVLEYVESFNSSKNEDQPQILPEDMIQIYFPYLADKNINTLSDLETNRQELVSATDELINDRPYKELIENTDLFYDVFYQKIETGNLNYVKRGISYIDLEIKPDYPINVPVDLLFKILHTSDEKPLFKLTRNSRDEKMYRLYANKISKNGKRIPYLKSTKINKIIREVQAEKRLMVLIHCKYVLNDSNTEFIIPIKCEFDNKGSVFISFELDNPMNDQQVSDIIIESVNPVINEVSIFLSQNDYSINQLDPNTGIYSSNVLVREIKYKAFLKLPSKFQFNTIFDNMKCISSIFNVIKFQKDNFIIMRYKRVSNYNEAEGREAYIMEQFSKSSYRQDVIIGLMENFQIDQAEALRNVADFLDRMDLSNVNQKGRIKINTHPGFMTTITQSKIVSGVKKYNYIIEVENIDNINYLDNIEIMINSFIRLLMYKQSSPNTNVPVELITKLCKSQSESSKKQSEIKEVKEFVVHGDKSVLTDNPISSEPDISEITFDFETAPRVDDIRGTDSMLANILFGDSDEEEEEAQSDEEKEEEAQSDEEKEEEEGIDVEVEENESGSNKSSPPSAEEEGIDVEVEENESGSNKSSPPSAEEEGIDVEVEENESGSNKSSPPSAEEEGIDVEVEENESGSNKSSSESKEKSDNGDQNEAEEEGIDVEVSFGSDNSSNSNDSSNSGGAGTPKEEESSSPEVMPADMGSAAVDTRNYDYASASDEEEDITPSRSGVMERDITNASLSNPNPFHKRLETYDPELFSRTDGIGTIYSTACPANFKRQPVILTDEEKAYIDKHHSGSYDRAMKYGSSESKNFWYICPRYWDLKRNVSLTTEQVDRIKEKEGDVIIPPGSKKVPAGKYIFEFTSSKYHIDEHGRYKNHSPGFAESKKNAGGKYCIPCCFSGENFFLPKQNTERQACGCPSITVHNQNNPNSRNFKCKGRSHAFRAPELPRKRGETIRPREDIEEGQEREEEEEVSPIQDISPMQGITDDEEVASEKIKKTSKQQHILKSTDLTKKDLLAKKTERGQNFDVIEEEEEQQQQQQQDSESGTPLSESQKETIRSIQDVSSKKIFKKEFIILGPERNTELKDGTMGYLLPPLQSFFLQSMKSCIVSDRNTSLKPGVSCLLQKGVQPGEIKHISTIQEENKKGFKIIKENIVYYNYNQSFIGAIADIYSKYNETITGKYEKTTIAQMKEIILNAIDIDSFMKYQNGTLINTFSIDYDNEDIFETDVGDESESDEENASQNDSDIDVLSKKQPNILDDTQSSSESLESTVGGEGSSDDENSNSDSETESESDIDILAHLKPLEKKKDESQSDEEGIDIESIEFQDNSGTPTSEESKLVKASKAQSAPVSDEEQKDDIPSLPSLPSVKGDDDEEGLPPPPPPPPQKQPQETSRNIVENIMENINPWTSVSSKSSNSSSKSNKTEDKLRMESKSKERRGSCIVDDQVFKLLVKKDNFKYKNSAIFKSIKKMSESDPQFAFFKKVVCSYENFERYISSKTAYIGYEYLWDIVSIPNAKLFKDGINLIILQIANRDITNNIEILCPTNHYSEGFFDSNKKTAILIKKNIKNKTFFEPIYEIREIKPRFFNCLFNIKSSATRKFKTTSGVVVEEPALPQVLKKAISTIKAAYDTQCKPYNSIPREGTPNASKKFVKLYEFSRNIQLYELKQRLESSGFEILNQILNFDGRVIGVFTQKEDEENNKTYSGIVMCEPSSIDNTIPEINYIDDETLWRPYEETIIFLDYVYNKIKIPCRPRFKVIDDGKIVGIVTETDQFISVTIDDNESKRTDGIFNIPVLNSSDYNIADEEINLRLKQDPIRERYVKYVYLENNFYNVFRNIVRILINKHENIKIKETLITIIKSQSPSSTSSGLYSNYIQKLTAIQLEVLTLISKYVTFSDTHYTDEILESITDITTSCLTNLNPNACEDTKYCLKETDQEGKCKLVIPKQNLINPEKDNKKMYIARVADELLRYNRIRTFMFDRKIFPYINVKYNLRQDEIILSQTMLLDGYFDNLEPVAENKYAHFNTYDTSDPLLTEIYENMYDASIEEHVTCTKDIIQLTRNYKEYFSLAPSNVKLLKFNANAPICTFEIILFILKNEAIRTSNKKLDLVTINKIKVVLVEFYSKCIEESSEDDIKDKFAKIIKYYGMDSISNEYRIKCASGDDEEFLETMPFLENYHLTRLDIWIIANYYELPIILLYYPNKSLIETNYNYSILTTFYNELGPRKESARLQLGTSDESDEVPESKNVQSYYFIVVPAINQNVAPSYSLVRKGINEYCLPLSDLKVKTQESIIQEQSKEYSSFDDPFREDREQVADESTGYVSHILKFIRKFKPPSTKRMKSDETSSMGTGASLDSQVLLDMEPEDEEILQESETGKSKPAKQRAKSTISLRTGLQLEGTEKLSSQGKILTIKEKQALKKAQQQQASAAAAAEAKSSLPGILESEELVIPSVSVPATAKSLTIKQKQELKRSAQAAAATSLASLSSNPPNI
jgi:hypothetical protein